MPYTAYELQESRQFESSTNGVRHTLVYVVEASTIAEADDVDALRAWVDANLPLIYGLGWRTQTTIRDRMTPNAWKVELQFNQQTKDSQTPTYPVKHSWSMEIGGRTVHITQSLNTLWSGVAVGDPLPQAKDFAGAINVTGDRVEGVDILEPVISYRETWTWQKGLITPGYVSTLQQLAGTINDADWRGYNKHDVLFTRASVEVKEDAPDDSEVKISYEFQIALSAYNVPVGPNITVPVKAGQDYLWAYYEEEIQSSTPQKYLRMYPRMAYVEQVYYEADFNLLGIG